MIGSVRCPNSAIAAPLAGAAEAPEAANSPSPVATIIARALLHISFSRVIPPVGFLEEREDVPSKRCHQAGRRCPVEDARQKDMHALAGWCTRRGEWPINGRRARGSASCGTRPCRSPPPRRGISSSNGRAATTLAPPGSPRGRERFQPRISVQRHQSEIVLGVLVIVLCSDDIPRPRFFLG
jgi:hypothetical protein